MIDKVILPTDLLGAIEDSGYSRFITGYNQANLKDTMNNPGPYTNLFLWTKHLIINFMVEIYLLFPKTNWCCYFDYHIVYNRMTEDDLMETWILITDNASINNYDDDNNTNQLFGANDSYHHYISHTNDLTVIKMGATTASVLTNSTKKQLLSTSVKIIVTIILCYY